MRADAQGRIVEAQFGRPDGSSDTAAGRIFILAANGVESPRLLLASADDTFPRGLANSSDQVGRNFMDHFGSQISLDTSVRLYPNRAPVFTSYIETLRDGAFRTSASAAMIHPSNQINVFDVTAELLKSDILPPALDAQIRDRVTRRAAFSVFVEQLPRPDNRITIDWNERDTAGQPRIRLAYTSDEYTKAGMQRAVELVGRLGPLLGASKITVSEPNSYNHPMGALRMGHDAKTAVVGAFGRAHDHPNLFVAGAAVFPSSGAASPTLTIAALSLRTAEAVIRQMG